MPSDKLRAAGRDEAPELAMNMSPMIDLVFLLLIFFMVNSTLIVNLKDQDVKIPTAPDAKTPERSIGRIVINILEDGEFRDEWSNQLSEAGITDHVREAADNHKKDDTESRILIRADKAAPVEYTKRAVKAAGAAGVFKVIFSSYTKDRK